MRVLVSSVGKFHHFDMCAQLLKHGHTARIVTGFPYFKTRSYGVPDSNVLNFPYVHALRQVDQVTRRIPTNVLALWDAVDRKSLGLYSARHIAGADVFIGASSIGLEGGRKQARRGAAFVCDRGSTHISHQSALLQEEAAHWGVPAPGPTDFVIDRELEEYELATRITVPSSWVARTFVERGIDASKIAVLPYGVDLKTYGRVQERSADGRSKVRILFVGRFSIRKGVLYLLAALRDLRHIDLSVDFVGSVDANVLAFAQRNGLIDDRVRFRGILHGRDLALAYSSADMLVLPSIEEGLALVLGQALASGCPVVATQSTGVSDLISDGEEGLVVTDRDAGALSIAIERLCVDSALRREMSDRAVARAAQIGGWDDYGHALNTLLGELRTSELR